MIKNIFCFICLLLIQNSFGQNLRFDEEGNLLNSRNPGRPIDFMKLVASKVKGEEKDGGKKEESENSSETIVGSFTNYLIELKNYLYEFFSPTTKDSSVSLVKLSLVKNYTIL